MEDRMEASRVSRTEAAGRRLSTETRRAPLTSEFWAYVLVVLATLIAADNIGGGSGRDYFTADKAWLYVVILTIGFVLARGWAKSGVRERYWETSAGDDSGEGAPLADRLKAAANVIKEGEPSPGAGPTTDTGGTAGARPGL
jgi:hypothetical protein